jgi:hypothetical protein
VVIVEYFTKWIEVKPLVNIATVGLKRFFRQNIICHFRVPRKITVDNAKQFDCYIFKDFYHQMGVKAIFTSVYHPQSNGAMKRANALIFSAIEKILEDHRRVNGQKTYRESYGATTPLFPEQQISRLSSCCMVRIQ